MTGKRYFLFLLEFFWMAHGSQAQHSSYSLQAAVDELHRREAAKYPLNAPPSQQHYFGAASDVDYWDDDSVFPANINNNYNNKNRNRHRVNKVLAKYLERENYDADHGGLSLGPFGGYEFDEDNNNFLSPYTGEKKLSSFFRERDNKNDNAPASVFRERETQSSGPADHSELTEQFLREIEESQEREREERYKETLRSLWEKYQQQQNEVNGDIFEEKKRMRMPPYYMLMQKKRSYPVLPWLPYSERKKRFPVAKRSTKRSASEMSNGLGKTDEKVARELSELFGQPVEEKKKRSTDEQTKFASTHAPNKGVASSSSVSDVLVEVSMKKDSENENTTEIATVSEKKLADYGGGNHEHHGKLHEHHGHSQKEHKHRKRSEHNSNESHEYDEDSESEEHEQDEQDAEMDEHEEEEEEEGVERKKKRDITSAKQINEGIFKSIQSIPEDLTSMRRKKSVDWSTYFGLDRKKKPIKRDDSKLSADVSKRSTAGNEVEDDGEKKKRDLDPEKLDSMDKKLQSIEDFIIDETIKYTGAHEGIANPEEIRRLKDHVLSRLATAYSLEKMRRALEKLRQSVDAENHLLRNVIEPASSSVEDNSLENQKRLSLKKDKATLHDRAQLASGNEISKELHSNAMMGAAVGKNTDDEDDDTKRKKKRNGYLRYPDLPNEFADSEEPSVTRYEALNDAYLGNKNYIIGSNQCSLIETMAERCRGVDLLSGDINQELLPICGVHQICYLCGTSQVACDYQYLSEADAICGNNDDCLTAARSVLMILRGTPGTQLGPRECLKNPCLYSAMREIGL